MVNGLYRAGLDPEEFECSFGTTDAAFDEGLKDAEILITAGSVIMRRRPGIAPNLKVIFFTSAGLDGVAPFDWVPSGCAILNNRGVHGRKAGEYAAMALLMLAMHMPSLLAAQREERWEQIFTPTVAGRSVTVVGLGDLGTAAAMRARTLGMNVTGVRSRLLPHPACDRVVGTEALDDVLPHTEFLVLACPLTAATRNLISRQRLNGLPEGAGIVNMARGGIIDEEALCDMLENRHLSGAVLDVFGVEPLPAGHRLWKAPNLIMTPHVCADDPAIYASLCLDIFCTNLKAYRAGEAMPNVVDMAKGY